jgi:hypothetical protein
MLWLDHLIFGNGYGMATPYHDGRLFWLVDTKDKDRHGRNGTLYRWNGWFGCQLRSTQWRHVRPGTRRRLGGREFVVWSSERRWLRVEVCWSLVGLPKEIDAANAMLREVERDLGRL